MENAEGHYTEKDYVEMVLKNGLYGNAVSFVKEIREGKYMLEPWKELFKEDLEEAEKRGEMKMKAALEEERAEKEKAEAKIEKAEAKMEKAEEEKEKAEEEKEKLRAELIREREERKKQEEKARKEHEKLEKLEKKFLQLENQLSRSGAAMV